MATTQIQIARRLGLDVSSVNKILNGRKGPVFRKETIQKVLRVARQMGYDFGKLKHGHRRSESRKETALEVELTIYRSDGSIFDRGTAIVRNVSLSGALLTALVLPHRALPLEACTIGIRGVSGLPKDIEIIGRPIRLKGDTAEVNLAMEFLSAEKLKAKRLIGRG